MAYLFELAEEFARLGQLRFIEEHGRKPVLVGRGIIGTLEEAKVRTPNRTFVSEMNPALQQALMDASIADRVWPIEKRPESRPGGPIHVGRDAENDLVIPEYSISRRHCAFKYEVTGLHLIDLGSTNGTFVNGVRLAPKEPVRLKPQALVILGRYEFEYLSGQVFLKRVEDEARRGSR